MSATDVDLDEVYTFAIQLGKDAGSMLQRAAEARFGSNRAPDAQYEKESAVDIVTQTDEGQSNVYKRAMFDWSIEVSPQRC